MDPQQRLLLETTWEALERAGHRARPGLADQDGVYLGMFGSEYQAGTGLDQLDGYVGTGSALSVASGCALHPGADRPGADGRYRRSSSLLAVHLAADALARARCDMALSAGPP